MFYAYLILINAACFLLMLTDKYRARKELWRIPEKVLFGVAAAGGSLGGLMGMYIFRHKTKHSKFTIGFPVLLIIQAIAYGCIISLT